MQNLKLKELPNKYAYCKLSKTNLELTKFLFEYREDFLSITQTSDEISLVCELTTLEDLEQHCPEIIKVEAPFKCFRIVGNLDFGLIGIVADIALVLAEQKISLCTISTFDTDYFFVKEDKFNPAKKALEAKSYLFT
ncbi:MAG: ACT domain-containing protein [Candidatus Caenarcaniphilales bacterium]|nr:ACT domain-containing protein [Candidatus Caenarcaniphilales bacterium]